MNKMQLDYIWWMMFWINYDSTFVTKPSKLAMMNISLLTIEVLNERHSRVSLEYLQDAINRVNLN